MLECSWDELWKRVQQAQDLDQIIAAHDTFLDSVISRCLLDNSSRVTHTHTQSWCVLCLGLPFSSHTSLSSASVCPPSLS